MQSVKEFVLRCLWVCTEAEPEPAPALAPAPAPATSDGLQAFALGLNKRLPTTTPAGAATWSRRRCPSTRRCRWWPPAAREGTLDELLRVLAAPSRDFLAGHVRALAEHVLADGSLTGGPRVSFACGVWHDSTTPLRPAYRAAAAESYKAVARSANFPPRGQVGEAVRQGAHEDGKFHRLDGTAVDAPFMRGLGRHNIACHDGFKVLQLRYVQGRSSPGQPQPPPIYSMCVFLPDARDGSGGSPTRSPATLAFCASTCRVTTSWSATSGCLNSRSASA
ncbi:Serpin-Z2A [Hordeum vulgare]|nr:Serpin-Z2A [Hordeum vulgare]